MLSPANHLPVHKTTALYAVIVTTCKLLVWCCADFPQCSHTVCKIQQTVLNTLQFMVRSKLFLMFCRLWPRQRSAWAFKVTQGIPWTATSLHSCRVLPCPWNLSWKTQPHQLLPINQTFSHPSQSTRLEWYKSASRTLTCNKVSVTAPLHSYSDLNLNITADWQSECVPNNASMCRR